MSDFGTDQFDPDANPNLTEVRAWGKRQEKRAEALEKALQEAEARVSGLEGENRKGAVKMAAQERGLSDVQLEQLYALKPEATVEDLGKFAEALGVEAKSTEAPAPAPEGEQSSSEGTESESESTEQAPPAPATGFTPVAGTGAPGKPHDWKEIVAAAKRGDTAFLERVAAEAARDPSKLQLPHADKIGD